MYKNKKAKVAIFFGILPALIVYLCVAVVPIFVSVYYSFFDWDGLSSLRYVGLGNYKEIFMDTMFWNAFRNNLVIIAAGLLGAIPLGLGMALLLNKKIKGIKFFRMSFFLPVVISAVIISLTWGFIYNADFGLLNRFLIALGLDNMVQNWLGNPKLAMLSVCIPYIWASFGLFMVIFLAAIQTIPKEIIEASEIDGTNRWQRLWYIIIPSIKETIIVTVIFSLSNSFRAFDLVYVMTGGGPANSTDVMTIYMYNNTFQYMRFGFGSAVSVVILLTSLVVILIAQYLARIEINDLKKSKFFKTKQEKITLNKKGGHQYNGIK